MKSATDKAEKQKYQKNCNENEALGSGVILYWDKLNQLIDKTPLGRQSNIATKARKCNVYRLGIYRNKNVLLYGG